MNQIKKSHRLIKESLVNEVDIEILTSHGRSPMFISPRTSSLTKLGSNYKDKLNIGVV